MSDRRDWPFDPVLWFALAMLTVACAALVRGCS